jgi:hypothetical protein
MAGLGIAFLAVAGGIIWAVTYFVRKQNRKLYDAQRTVTRTAAVAAYADDQLAAAHARGDEALALARDAIPAARLINTVHAQMNVMLGIAGATREELEAAGLTVADVTPPAPVLPLYARHDPRSITPGVPEYTPPGLPAPPPGYRYGDSGRQAAS